MERVAEVKRETKETSIVVRLNLDNATKRDISTGIPFFDHMLNSMAFHGNFGLVIHAHGDLDVDFHHTVEDVGLVLGDAFLNVFRQNNQINRFGFAVIPMDDALSEVVVDVGGRPYLHYTGDYVQQLIRDFDVSLLREFFYALSVRARINLHINVRYGVNTHHIAESIFKALGKALREAYTLSSDSSVTGISAKGLI